METKFLAEFAASSTSNRVLFLCEKLLDFIKLSQSQEWLDSDYLNLKDLSFENVSEEHLARLYYALAHYLKPHESLKKISEALQKEIIQRKKKFISQQEDTLGEKRKKVLLQSQIVVRMRF